MAAIAPAQAQSLGNGFNDPGVDSRLQIGVTIPFGSQKGDDYRQLRLEIASVRRAGTDLDYNFRPDRQREIRRSFALKLEKERKFLVNRRFAEQLDNRNNISEPLLIGGIIVGSIPVGVAIVIISADNFGDGN